MAGYGRWSMSNNAREAYEQGEMPKSKWTKKVIIEVLQEMIDLEDLDLDLDLIHKLSKKNLWRNFIIFSSAHHTSKLYNMTDFYEIDEDYLLNCNNDKLKELIELQKTPYVIDGDTYRDGKQIGFHHFPRFRSKKAAIKWLENNGYKKIDESFHSYQKFIKEGKYFIKVDKNIVRKIY